MTDEVKPALNRKSRVITQGDRRSPNRAMLRAVGFNDNDFNKPKPTGDFAQRKISINRNKYN